ncbi:hypothetical protein OQA88_9296 [Cercophora sp. LCS_1]
MATTTMPPPTRAEIVFDELSTSYEAAFSDLDYQHTAINWVLSELAASNIHPAKIVDIGCGPGVPVCSTLSEAGHDVLGTDVSGGMVDVARKRVPNATFLKVDTRDWNPPAEEFDAVIIMFSILIGVTKDEIRETIAKAYRMLKPGGVFLFATVAIEGEDVEVVWVGRSIPCTNFSPEGTVDAIKAVGFELVKSEETKYWPGKAAGTGICREDQVWEEPLLWIYARKPRGV